MVSFDKMALANGWMGTAKQGKDANHCRLGWALWGEARRMTLG
jgi:hypothetical protein